MAEKSLGAELLVQVAIVVRDIEAAVANFARVLDVPEVEIRESREPEEAQTRFRGEPTDARARLAFIEMGQAHIELIEPVGGPSVWQEFLDEHGPGVHHIAFRTPDMDSAKKRLDQEGIGVLQEGKFRSGQYLYADTTDQLGVVLELLHIYDGQ
ncbi:MAG: VOC family protein [Acidobacteriota bacterium]|nr:VOC family protein [Acidobacteriota bacterium]